MKYDKALDVFSVFPLRTYMVYCLLSEGEQLQCEFAQSTRVLAHVASTDVVPTRTF